MVEPVPLNGAVSAGRTGVNRVPAPNTFFGPHLGLAAGRTELVPRWRTYKVRPATHSFETGTLAHELLAAPDEL